MTCARVAIAALWSLLCISLALAPSRARAESELVLDWRGPSTCPDATWALVRVRERLGRELASEVASGLHVHAELTRKDTGFSLSLTTQHGAHEGQRALSGASCEEIAEAAVLVIALAIDPEAVARSAATPSSEAPTREPEQAAVDPERPPGVRAEAAGRPDSPRPQTDPFVAVRIDALGDLGDLPAPGIGPAGAIGYERGWARVELRGLYLPATSGSDAPDVGRVRVGLWALGPTGCARALGQRASLFLCAGVELGQTVARGLGLDKDSERHAVWRAVTLAPRLAIGLTKQLGLVLEVGALAPLGALRFVSTDAQGKANTTLFESSRISGRATLGLELRI